MPAWAVITLLTLGALAALFCFLLFLIRFRLLFEYASPTHARGSFTISFLWLRKVFAFGPTASPGAAPTPGSPGPDAPPPVTQSSVTSPSGQAGFLGIDVPARLRLFKQRLRLAGRRWIVDLPVWAIALGYLRRTAVRLLYFPRLRLVFLHVGLEDVETLGRIASAWSAVSAMVPALACPVEYGFNERPFALRLRARGGSNGLALVGFVCVLLFTFPWVRLGARFAYCWRHPELNLWQRRLLLS